MAQKRFETFGSSVRFHRFQEDEALGFELLRVFGQELCVEKAHKNEYIDPKIEYTHQESFKPILMVQSVGSCRSSVWLKSQLPIKKQLTIKTQHKKAAKTPSGTYGLSCKEHFIASG